MAEVAEVRNGSWPPVLERESAFSYACAACGRCCHNKLIRLNAYEVARLAHGAGLSTTEFLDTHVDRQFGVLKQSDHGSCVLLDGTRCRFHADRPLACRLYPLGRVVAADSSEMFELLPLHPDTQAQRADVGHVSDYLEAQQVDDFVAAERKYAALFHRLLATCTDEEGLSDAAVSTSAEVPLDPLALAYDMDLTVRSYCGMAGIDPPTDLAGRTHLHLRAIEVFLELSSDQEEHHP